MQSQFFRIAIFNFFAISLSLQLHASPPVDDGYQLRKDIRQTLGFVPQFLAKYPSAGAIGAWLDFKNLSFNPNTAMSSQAKELIGLAAAAQVPCSYCTYFHTKAAKAVGASSEQLKEAVQIAAMVRRTTTILNGLAVKDVQVRKEIKQVLQVLRQNSGRMMQPSSPVRWGMFASPEEAYHDIKQSLGFVPSLLQLYPKAALPGLWMQIKGVALNPRSQIPAKQKMLIALGVAAQEPEDNLIHFYREAAILFGANAIEIREALAIAGLTQHWSTYFNGMQIDREQFRKDIDRIVKRLKVLTAQEKIDRKVS